VYSALSATPTLRDAVADGKDVNRFRIGGQTSAHDTAEQNSAAEKSL
jgi:hypothetical protein